MIPVILVVDDEDERFRSYVEELFRSTGTYAVVSAETWAEGYERALKHGADLRLVLIDQMLDDDRRGTDLVRIIRNRQPATPIVLVTADDNEAVMDEARRAGATAFFPKRAVSKSNAAIAKTFVYWAQGGAFPVNHLDRLTTFIRAFAHRSRGCIQRFKTANDAGLASCNKLSDIDTSEIDGLDAEFERIVEIYRTFEEYQSEETTFDIADVVQEEIRKLKATNRVFNYNGASVSVIADRELIRLAIREILDNAVKYSAKLAKGATSLAPIKVEIARLIKTEIEFCVVRVRDYGQCLEDEDIGIIHNAYVRGRNAVHTSTYGSGLGLNLVGRVLEMVRVGDATGYCTVDRPDDGGAGATAELFIPIASPRK